MRNRNISFAEFDPARNISCNCSSLCLVCHCNGSQQQKQPPRVSTAEEKFIRDYRDRWDKYYLETGEKRARAVSECLTNALIEGGVRL